MNTELQHQHYCTVCQEIVGTHPQNHREEEHDGSFDVDVLLIDYQDSDGRWIAEPDDMGHYSLHSWMDVDGQDMCRECGAVRITSDNTTMTQYISDIIASKEKQVILILLGAVMIGCFGLGSAVVALGAGFYEDVVFIGVSTAMAMITLVIIALSLEKRIRV